MIKERSGRGLIKGTNLAFAWKDEGKLSWDNRSVGRDLNQGSTGDRFPGVKKQRILQITWFMEG